MDGIIGPVLTATTGGPPLQAHVAHLRHLSKPQTARRILKDRFNLNKEEVKESADPLAAHVNQALEFHEASRIVRHSVRPVLQYYSFLNLAVATILAYRPPNHLNTRSHGVSDRTHSLTAVDLSSKVIETDTGTVTKFHEILSAAPIERSVFRLRELFVAIPMLAVELHDAFGVSITTIQVRTSTITDNDTKPKPVRSQVQFNVHWPSDTALNRKRFPRKAVERAMPLLANGYEFASGDAQQAIYRSKKRWSTQQQRSASRTHSANCLRFVNFGGHITDSMGSHYQWRYNPKTRILPTMTASLLTSFFLASVFRYRPKLARSLEDSRLNILAEVFINEADEFMLPAFRNLLYREEMTISSSALA